MATFCTSCGSPVEENLKFCPKCGTQLGAPSAPTPGGAGPTAQATGGVPPAPAAAASTAKKGSPVLKIILGVVAFFVVIGVLVAGAGIYFFYKAKEKVSSIVETAKSVTAGHGTPELRLEKGGEGSKSAASATLDVPPYPGSIATESGGGMNLGSLGGVSGQEFETSDSTDKVVAFYKDKFGSKINVQQSEDTAMFTFTTGNGTTTVTITHDEDAGMTKINITRVGK